MKCTDILKEEHKLILSKVKQMQEQLKEPLSGVAEEIEGHLTFIKTFADAYHHAKEEDIYFKWILSKNPGMKDGPIHCMLSEHDEGREYVQKASEALKAFKGGSEDQEEAVKRSLNAYSILIQNHIQKEDNILYQMAEQIDREAGDGDRVMLSQFEAVPAPTL